MSTSSKCTGKFKGQRGPRHEKETVLDIQRKGLPLVQQGGLVSPQGTRVARTLVQAERELQGVHGVQRFLGQLPILGRPCPAKNIRQRGPWNLTGGPNLPRTIYKPVCFLESLNRGRTKILAKASLAAETS